MMLDIKPFYFGILISHIYEKGEIYPAEILNISNKDILSVFKSSIRNIAALCFSINYPTCISVPHGIINSYIDILALGLSCSNYEWDKLVSLKESLISNLEINKENDISNKKNINIEIDKEDIEEVAQESTYNACALFDDSKSDDSSSKSS